MRKRACDSCYQRKIQCDAATPRCDWCRHHDLPCTFNRPISTRRRGKAKKTLLAAAEREAQLRAQAEAQAQAQAQEQAQAQAPGQAHQAQSPQPPAQPSQAPQAPVQGQDPEVLSPSLTLDSLSSPSPILNWNAPFTPSSSADTATSTSATSYGSPESSSLVTSPGLLSDHFMGSPMRAESPAPPPQGPIFGRLHFAGRHLGDISLHNGIPFLSAEGQRWIAARTGEAAPLQGLCAAAPSNRSRHGVHPAFLCASMSHLGTAMDLPDRRVVEECLELFSSNPYKRIWPAVDAVLFRRTIDAAYDERAGRCSIDATGARACIFAFMALLALHHMYPKSMPTLDSEDCAVQAQYLLPQVLHETSLDGLQTCFLLSLYHLLLGQLQKSSVYHSVACRMMLTLGANTTVVPPLTAHEMPDSAWRYKNHLRKLFWMIYCNDKEISLRTGQPPSINDDDCDMTLPHAYVDFKYVDDIPEFEPLLMDDTAVPILPGDIRLDMIKSRTYAMLYSARAMRKSDAELIRDIRQLDDELEAWRMSVPPSFRPSLALREQQSQMDLSDPRKMERNMIHFQYHHLVATIHAATGRCRSVSGYEVEGVNSSLALAVEASRSTLLYARVIVHELMGEVFWMAVFYPLSAIWIIFCNLLNSPLDPNANVDLELLNSAPLLIKEMRLRRLARDEMAHMKMIDDFVAELARLGNAAVLKARQEQNMGIAFGISPRTLGIKGGLLG
ncbi:hypothetical protein VTJ83DRAFT_2770 [Remersonia thermophila]|uniref:Zn(2)-C6 fungal-type domain-containing protein n=1 Tax=Remersonia thermophila TaxID=72144 RepID=A0ABR4DJM5_9PEZI